MDGTHLNFLVLGIVLGFVTGLRAAGYLFLEKGGVNPDPTKGPPEPPPPPPPPPGAYPRNMPQPYREGPYSPPVPDSFNVKDKAADAPHH